MLDWVRRMSASICASSASGQLSCGRLEYSHQPAAATAPTCFSKGRHYHDDWVRYTQGPLSYHHSLQGHARPARQRAPRCRRLAPVRLERCQHFVGGGIDGVFHTDAVLVALHARQTLDPKLLHRVLCCTCVCAGVCKFQECGIPVLFGCRPLQTRCGSTHAAGTNPAQTRPFACSIGCTPVSDGAAWVVPDVGPAYRCKDDVEHSAVLLGLGNNILQR